MSTLILPIRNLCTVILLTLGLVSGVGADPTPQLHENKVLQPPDAAAGDWFGFSVAISGDLVAVGSRSDDDACVANPNCDSGSVYVFGKDQGGAGNWGLIKKITASDARAGDWFGEKIALDVSTLVVGASGRNGIGTDSGAVYVYERNSGGTDNWGESKIITPSDPEPEHRFGSIVSLSGATLVASAPWDDEVCPLDPNCNSGAAYVFYRDQGGANSWGQVKKILASDAAENDRFGGCFIDGDILLIGSAWDDDACPLNPDCNSGAAYVYYRNQGGADNWGEVKKLTASDAAAGDGFGRAGTAVVSGNTAVVGALFGDGIEADSGSAYVFERNLGGTDNWGEVTELMASNGHTQDWFGEGVAISNDAISIGARFGDGNVTDSGAAYWYQRDQGGPDVWGEAYILTHSGGQNNDFFGADVSSNDSFVVAGARQDGLGGAAFLFDVSDLTFSELIFADGFEDQFP